MTNPISDHEPHHIPVPKVGPDDSDKSLLAPVLLAAVILTAVIFTLVHYTYHKYPSTGAIISTTIYPIHTAPPQSGGIRIASAHGEDQVYLLTVVEIYNHLKLPIFVKSFAVDVTTQGGDTLQCMAAQTGDFQPMYAMYPDLARGQTTKDNAPLLRDTRIEPNNTTHGLVMVHFPISKDVWAHRQSATLTVSFYHQSPLSIPFPQNQ
jgi:hypothetical protein